MRPSYGAPSVMPVKGTLIFRKTLGGSRTSPHRRSNCARPPPHRYSRMPPHTSPRTEGASPSPESARRVRLRLSALAPAPWLIAQTSRLLGRIPFHPLVGAPHVPAMDAGPERYEVGARGVLRVLLRERSGGHPFPKAPGGPAR